MIFIIYITIFYLLCVYCAYKDIQISHSKNGIWQNTNAGIMDIFFMVFPIVNIIPTLSYMLGGCYRDKKKERINCNKFCRISK